MWLQQSPKNIKQKMTEVIREIDNSTIIDNSGTSLVIQWLRLDTPNADSPNPGFDPWLGN